MARPRRRDQAPDVEQRPAEREADRDRLPQQVGERDGQPERVQAAGDREAGVQERAVAGREVEAVADQDVVAASRIQEKYWSWSAASRPSAPERGRPLVRRAARTTKAKPVRTMRTAHSTRSSPSARRAARTPTDQPCPGATSGLRPPVASSPGQGCRPASGIDLDAGSRRPRCRPFVCAACGGSCSLQHAPRVGRELAGERGGAVGGEGLHGDRCILADGGVADGARPVSIVCAALRRNGRSQAAAARRGPSAARPPPARDRDPGGPRIGEQLGAGLRERGVVARRRPRGRGRGPRRGRRGRRRRSSPPAGRPTGSRRCGCGRRSGSRGGRGGRRRRGRLRAATRRAARTGPSRG